MQNNDRNSRTPMAKRAFMPLTVESARTVAQDTEKQWFGSRDASTVIAKRRDAGIGKTVDAYNTSSNTSNTIHTIQSALRRARG